MKKNGNEEYHQVNTYDKNEVNKSIEENTKKIEQTTINQIEKIIIEQNEAVCIKLIKLLVNKSKSKKSNCIYPSF